MALHEPDLGHNTMIEIFELYFRGGDEVIQYFNDWYNYSILRSLYDFFLKYLMHLEQDQQHHQSPTQTEMECSHVADVELLHPSTGMIFENQQYQYRYSQWPWQIFLSYGKSARGILHIRHFVWTFCLYKILDNFDYNRYSWIGQIEQTNTFVGL